MRERSRSALLKRGNGMRGPAMKPAAIETAPAARTARQIVPAGIPGVPCIPVGMLWCARTATASTAMTATAATERRDRRRTRLSTRGLIRVVRARGRRRFISHALRQCLTP